MAISYKNSSRNVVNGVPVKKRVQTKTKESTKRQPMLNTHRIAPFKYDLNEIIVTTKMDQATASAFTASVIAKASRQSARDAKDYTKEFLDNESLTKDESDRICRLIDKYSKYR